MLRRNALSGMLHHAIDFNLSGVFPVNQQLGIHRDMADRASLAIKYWSCFLVTGVALPATIKIEPRWPSAVRLAGALLRASRIRPRRTASRSVKGPGSTASTFQFRDTTAPGDGIDIVDGYRIDPLSPARRAVVVPANPAGFALRLSSPMSARYARPDDGSAPPTVRHPRLGDRGTLHREPHRSATGATESITGVTADENTP